MEKNITRPEQTKVKHLSGPLYQPVSSHLTLQAIPLLLTVIFYRKHLKNGEGNVFSLFVHRGGGGVTLVLWFLVCGPMSFAPGEVPQVPTWGII